MQGSQIFTGAIGQSFEKRDIRVQANFPLKAPPPPHLTLLIGGQHGDEPATVALLESFAARHLGLLTKSPAAIITCANPDGLALGTRYNARAVDLNRNCGFNWHSASEEPSGPAAWSEPESCALRDFILQWQPAKIVSLHWALAELDADGAQSSRLAEAMWAAMTPPQRLPYRLRVTELGRGQRRLQQTYAECPGSLGQWCGYGLQYASGAAPAMITLELPYDPTVERPESLPADHLQTLRAQWSHDSAAYLRAVEGGVHAMLLTACEFLQD